MRAKSRMDRGRKKKMEDKEKTGAKILMPEVFVSNYMKQQRNFVKYRREKKKVTQAEGKPGKLAPSETIKPNTLILAVRVKE